MARTPDSCRLHPLAEARGLRVDACAHGTVHVSGRNWTIRMSRDELLALGQVAAEAASRIEAVSPVRPRLAS